MSNVPCKFTRLQSYSARLAVLLWHVVSDQATLGQYRCLPHVVWLVSEENPPHPIHSSRDKCGCQTCHRLIGCVDSALQSSSQKTRQRRTLQSTGSCNEQRTYRMEKAKRTSLRNVAEKWELFPEMFSPSTSASTRLGIVLQIVSSGTNWSTPLCSSRSTPSRRINQCAA